MNANGERQLNEEIIKNLGSHLFICDLKIEIKAMINNYDDYQIPLLKQSLQILFFYY